MSIINGDVSEGTGSSGTQKGRRGRPRRSNPVTQISNLESEESSMNDIPVEKNGVVSVCEIELLTEEDKTIPDAKLASYNIEEEFVGFGVGLSTGFDRYFQSNGFNSMGGGNTGIRLCYSGLWRKLPQNVPVRELAMSRYHIAVLLNNGHVYVTLNDMNESLYGNFENYQKISGVLVNSQQERPESGNEQRNSINSSNTLLLESSIVQGSWLNIKELDDKNIRGLRIASIAVEAGNFEHKFGIKSFVLACLTSEGKIWIVEHNSSVQGGFNNLRHIDLRQLNPKNQDETKDKSLTGNEFYRAVDVTLSEMIPIYGKSFEKIEKVEEINEYQDITSENFLPSFPYKYGMAITSLLVDGQSSSIILKKNTEISNYDKMVVLDLPVTCRKTFCGPNADFGLILLQNGLLWSWDRREGLIKQVRQSHDPPKSCISIREFNQSDQEHFSEKINLRVLNGSLFGRKVIDFSGMNGEFIALTQDGIVHEWNDPDRMSIFKRPLILNPIILTPKTHHLIVKKALSNGGYWSFDAITLKCNQVPDIQKPFKDDNIKKIDLNTGVIKEMMNREINEMYDPNNRIIGVWLLEGITLVLYKDGVLKALYNYLGRDGYDTKVGFISEEDELCWNRQNSSIKNCILLSSRLGRCIPANPIALVGLLSNFERGKSLSDKQKQLIIQRSLVKLSLREKPVYRILACYNSIVLGILRSNAKWRPGRGQNSKKAQPSKLICKSDPSSQEQFKLNDEEMNFSATVNLKDVKEIVQNQENKEDSNPETFTCNKNHVANLSTNQELSTLQIPSVKDTETILNKKVDIHDQNQVPNKGRGSSSKKPSSRKSCNSVKVIASSIKNAQDNTPINSSTTTNSAMISTSNTNIHVTTNTVSTMDESPTLSKNEPNPSIETNNVNPTSYKLSKDTTSKRRNDPDSSPFSSSVPPTSNRRSSVCSQKAFNNTSKAQVNSKTRKRERRSLSKSEDKENANCMNNLDNKSLYNTEKEEEHSPWGSKKLSLVEYEVEQILSIREKPLTKQKEYLIKWKVPGHPVQPTWEPEENLNGCEELLQDFLKSIKTSRSGRLLLPCTAINKIT
ncbi:chromatin associated protein [Cryptosporidium ubiquitum]|uniref:Chromatin associated protein n=1 Tax=Cryptosporidium ubiquitum TaxID=857276 RepID=A0A1J4MM82_9CRYT|nr:chromatin associated protein [Cryptosporidium ubiquitum]OII75378.1 chromatin associated protein [Cryptosporidium ubiquitum]